MTAPGSKSRGCFQCSKRRIICDGGEPTCRKCQKKGIECSGLGRFRFSAGVATRGKLKGCTIPVVNVSPASAFQEWQQPELTVPQKIQWKAERPQLERRKASKEQEPGSKRHESLQPSSESAVQGHLLLSFGSDCVREAIDEDNGRQKETGHSDEQGYVGTASLGDTDEAVNSLRNRVQISQGRASITPWIAPLSPQARMLFSHFALEVAPVMVVLDQVCNGYRDFILPMACEDGVLRRAVSVVAAQHLALRNPRFQSAAEAGRAAIISRLRRDSLQASPDHVFNISTWATVIVLLVGETVTANSEYNHLLRILMCLARNISQMAPSSANRFLMQQTHMFEFLGQPLVGEAQGIDALRLPLDHYLDWISYDLPPESEYNHVIHWSRLAFIKASQIYIGRATSNQDQWELLESLKQLVSQIEPDRAGSHALVWVCFIAAADSTDPEHRRFFTDRLNRIYAQTRFRNIAAAVQSLPAIWAQQVSQRWTEHLLRLAPTLVM